VSGAAGRGARSVTSSPRQRSSCSPSRRRCEPAAGNMTVA
jgi:hypothetical protein